MRAIEALVFVPVALGIHLGLWAMTPNLSGASTTGGAGQSQVTLAASAPQYAALIQTWQAPPQIAPSPAPLIATSAPADLPQLPVQQNVPTPMPLSSLTPPTPVAQPVSQPEPAQPLVAPTVPVQPKIRATIDLPNLPMVQNAPTLTAAPSLPDAAPVSAPMAPPTLPDQAPIRVPDAPHQPPASPQIAAPELAALLPAPTQNPPPSLPRALPGALPQLNPTPPQMPTLQEPVAPELPQPNQLTTSLRPKQRPAPARPEKIDQTPAPTPKPSKKQARPTPAQNASGGGKSARPTTGQSGRDATQSVNAATRSALQSRWGAKIQARVHRRLIYPRGATGTGTARVSLSVDRNGRLVGLRLIRSSGVAVFDQAALSAVRRAGRFPKAPRELHKSSYTFSLSLSFRP